MWGGERLSRAGLDVLQAAAPVTDAGSERPVHHGFCSNRQALKEFTMADRDDVIDTLNDLIDRETQVEE